MTVYNFLVGISGFLFLGLLYLNSSRNNESKQRNLMQFRPEDKITVRVNTYRRNDLLTVFLESYSSCNDIIKEIQVVWSDVHNKPPKELLDLYKQDSIVRFEIHANNSLNNRFNPLLNIVTEAVLSIDDDIVMSCDQLIDSYKIWKSNKKTIVGYSGRMILNNLDSSEYVYKKWQHTWWNGIYNVILTKAAFIHAEYVHDYNRYIDKSIMKYIDEHRNCEDIAMQYLVSMRSSSPPVWIEGTLYEIGEGTGNGISSKSSHFDERSKCSNFIHNQLSKTSEWTPSPLHTGYQKSVSLSYTWAALYRLWFSDPFSNKL